MLGRAAIVAFIVGAGMPASSDAAPVAPSGTDEKWISTWAKICPAAAPTFARFDALARGQGFVRLPNKQYFVPNTETVISLLPHPRGACYCMMTYATSDPKQANVRIERVVKAHLGRTFRVRTAAEVGFGDIATSDGPLLVRVYSFSRRNLDWIGLVLEGRSACPSDAMTDRHKVALIDASAAERSSPAAGKPIHLLIPS